MTRTTSRVYEPGDHLKEHPTVGGLVVATAFFAGRCYLLVHRCCEENDMFALYVQDLRFKTPPTLTRKWPGAILEQLLDELRDYRREHGGKPIPTPIPVRSAPAGLGGRGSMEDRCAAESGEPPAAAPARSLHGGDVGLCL